jgi:hypothetical protein
MIGRSNHKTLKIQTVQLSVLGHKDPSKTSPPVQTQPHYTVVLNTEC